MDVTIWTKFDKEPITLRAISDQAAWTFDARVRSSEGDYAYLHTVDGYHMIRREHILRVHIWSETDREEG